MASALVRFAAEGKNLDIVTSVNQAGRIQHTEEIGATPTLFAAQVSRYYRDPAGTRPRSGSDYWPPCCPPVTRSRVEGLDRQLSLPGGIGVLPGVRGSWRRRDESVDVALVGLAGDVPPLPPGGPVPRLDVQNLTTCQVRPPLPVSSSCPSMSPKYGCPWMTRPSRVVVKPRSFQPWPPSG